MNNHLLPFPYNQSGPHIRFSRLYQRLANILLWLHKQITPLASAQSRLPSNPVRVVCVSDTHNTTPEIPDGDIFIHAGDLTQAGTFAELQAQLTWIQSLPHTFKLVVAGNHDLLLDDAFAERFPHRLSSRAGCDRDELSWGDIHYLRDASVTLKFEKCGGRSVRVFGSPNTPEFGTWAFQYPPIKDVWTNRIPDDVDVVVAHGPPVLHLDVDRKGDGYFLQELRRVQPKLAVFGHVHDGYGEETMYHDGVESSAEEINMRWGGVYPLTRMMLALLALPWKRWVHGRGQQYTKLVNAATAAGETTGSGKVPICVLI